MVGNLAVCGNEPGRLQGQWDLRTMWGTMSIIAKAVVFILFVLSAWSFGVMIDRALMYSAARKQSRVFVQQVAGALREGKLDEAISIAERNKKSHIAKVVATGLSEFQSASSQVSECRSGRSRQARSRPLRRHRARRNEARPFAAWPPSVRRRRSSDCSARWSASSTRLRASRPARRPVCRQSPAVFRKRLVTTALGLARGRSRRVGVQLLHQQGGSLRRRDGQLLDGVDQLLHHAPGRRKEVTHGHTSHKPARRWRPRTSFPWPTSCSCC